MNSAGRLCNGAGACKLADPRTELAETVTAIGSQVLIDADLRKEIPFVAQNLIRGALAEEVTQQGSDSFHDGRVGVTPKSAMSLKQSYEP